MRRMLNKKEIEAIAGGAGGGVPTTSKPYNVYCTDSGGNQITTEYDTGNSNSVKANSFAKRSNHGTLKANDPIEDNDVVTKKYLNGNLIDLSKPYTEGVLQSDEITINFNKPLTKGIYCITFTELSSNNNTFSHMVFINFSDDTCNVIDTTIYWSIYSLNGGHFHIEPLNRVITSMKNQDGNEEDSTMDAKDIKVYKLS